VTEQRRYRRFDLQLPLELVRAGSRVLQKPGITRNLSSRGVLFTVDSGLEVGASIEYIITLSESPTPAGPVQLRCIGKVVRQHSPGGEHGQQPAWGATLERHEFVRPPRQS
jgi:hypothetical protein